MTGSFVAALPSLVLVSFTGLDFCNTSLLFLGMPSHKPPHVQLCNVKAIRPSVMWLRGGATIMGHVPLRPEYLIQGNDREISCACFWAYMMYFYKYGLYIVMFQMQSCIRRPYKTKDAYKIPARHRCSTGRLIQLTKQRLEWWEIFQNG